MSTQLHFKPATGPRRVLSRKEILSEKPRYLVYHHPDNAYSTRVVNAMLALPQMRLKVQLADIRKMKRLPGWLVSFPGIADRKTKRCYFGNVGLKAWFGLHTKRDWRSIMQLKRKTVARVGRKPQKEKLTRKEAEAILSRPLPGLRGREVSEEEKMRINAMMQKRADAKRQQGSGKKISEAEIFKKSDQAYSRFASRM